jgi:ribosome maturation factor RimP
MRENSRRGAPRQARAAGGASAGRPDAGRAGTSRAGAGRAGTGRPGGGRDARDRAAGGRGSGPGGTLPGGTVPGGAATSHDGGRPDRAGPAGPPAGADQAKLTGLIEPVLAAMDMDLEGLKVASAGRRRVLRIIVDADGGVSLDDIAEVSREVSAKLDTADGMGDTPYTLEVSSPGVDRPLTQPRHWRRAAGRLVAVQVHGQDRDSERDAADHPVPIQARVIDADQDRVTLELDGARRTFRHAELGPGRVQIEFGRLDEADDADERDDVGETADVGPAVGLADAEDGYSGAANVNGARASSHYLDAEGAHDFGDGADEEDPDGH